MMNRNKAAESEGTIREMLSALEDFGIEKFSFSYVTCPFRTEAIMALHHFLFFVDLNR